MSKRAEKILSNEFFKDKQDLAKQIIEFENEGKGFLPNEPETRHLEFQVGEQNLLIGRVHHYYYLGFLNAENQQWRHDVYYNKINFTQFFVNNYETIKAKSEPEEYNDIDKQKAFWLNQIERVS